MWPPPTAEHQYTSGLPAKPPSKGNVGLQVRMCRVVAAIAAKLFSQYVLEAAGYRQVLDDNF